MVDIYFIFYMEHCYADHKRVVSAVPQAHWMSPEFLYSPHFQPLINTCLNSSSAIRPGIDVHEFKSMMDCMLVSLREARHGVTMHPLRENACSQSTDAAVW